MRNPKVLDEIAAGNRGAPPISLTTEERFEKLEKELAGATRRSRLLVIVAAVIVALVFLLGAGCANANAKRITWAVEFRVTGDAPYGANIVYQIGYDDKDKRHAAWGCDLPWSYSFTGCGGQWVGIHVTGSSEDRMGNAFVRPVGGPFTVAIYLNGELWESVNTAGGENPLIDELPRRRYFKQPEPAGAVLLKTLVYPLVGIVLVLVVAVLGLWLVSLTTDGIDAVLRHIRHKR